MKPVTSWGRLSADPHHVLGLNHPSRVKALVCESTDLGLAHGMGRSYGDVCLNSGGTLWVTTGLDHFIAFDDSTGRLVCEAGVLLRDIQRQTSVARQAEARGKQLAERAGLSVSHLFGDGVRGVDGVAILHLWERVCQSVTNDFTDSTRRTIGPKAGKKSGLIAARASKCTLDWVNPGLPTEFKGEDQDA